MTNTSKFWIGALIVAGVGAGAVVANRDRISEAPVVPAAMATPAPVVEKAALPMPKPRTHEPASVEPLVMTDELAAEAKPLLNKGTDLTMASEGFATRESFLATARAAKENGIPFVLLKDRVVAHKKPLKVAVRELTSRQE
jgi:hypothetical protein